MIMGFLWVNNKTDFEAVLSAGLVDSDTIAFIKDSREIWTHGMYFAGGDALTKDEVSQMIDDSITQVLNQET